MFFLGARFALPLSHLERPDELVPGVGRFDDGVHKALAGGGVRVGEFFAVLFDFFLPQGFGIICRLDLAPEDDVSRTVRAHHGDLRHGVGEYAVIAEP